MMASARAQRKRILVAAVVLALSCNSWAAPPASQPAPGETPFVHAFDALWTDMDLHYSYFSLKKIDWNALKTKYRPRAAAASNQKAFVEVLKQMLAELKDMHIWIDTPDGRVGVFGIPWRRNWNPKALASRLTGQTRIGDYAIVGKTKPEGFGVFILVNQGKATDETVGQAVEAIRALKDTPAFIVDLRPGASGGSEPLAQRIASLFCAQDTVYAKHRYRSGPGHDDFTQDSSRVLQAAPDAYTKPVVCLIGHVCMSSGEAFVKMMGCLPHVTTIGDITRGATGNPKPFPLPGLPIQVYYSRWLDMMPDGQPIEGNGIMPDIRMSLPQDAFNQNDPVWNRGLQVLRQKLAAAQTQPAAAR